MFQTVFCRLHNKWQIDFVLEEMAKFDNKCLLCPSFRHEHSIPNQLSSWTLSLGWMTGFWCKRVLCVFNVLSTNVKDDTAQICIVIMWFKDSVPDGNGFNLWHSFLFSSYWLLEKYPRCKAISPSPLAIWTFPLGYIPSSWPFFPLTFADTECTFPPCTSTAYGWGIFLRSLRCCRSPRKSFSAWRPCSSLALVSTLQRAKNENIKKWTYRGVSTVRNEHDFFSFYFHQFPLRVWRVRSTLTNCVSPTSTNSTASSTFKRLRTHLRGSTSSHDSWTLSRWWVGEMFLQAKNKNPYSKKIHSYFCKCF